MSAAPEVFGGICGLGPARRENPPRFASPTPSTRRAVSENGRFRPGTTYQSSGSAITITGYSGPGGVVVPGTIAALPVTVIGDNAFGFQPSLTSVALPNSVTSIGDEAFYHCTGLTGITLPSGVTSIGLFAFGECTALTTLSLPSSVTSIGPDAVLACTALTGIHVDPLNSSYSSTDGVLFDKTQEILVRYPGGKSGIHTAPDSVTRIGIGAFYECTGLMSATLPNVTIIEGAAFQSCLGLTNVTLPNSLTNIGWQAFLETGLTSVTIPSSVTTIDTAAFAFTKLTTVTLPNGLTHLEVYMFRSCPQLTTVILPKSLTSIGEYIFKHPTEPDVAVTDVYFKGNAPTIVGSPAAVFYGANNATVYYRAGTTGWGSTFAGRPTALWVVPTYSQWAASFDLGVQYPNANGPQNDADQDGVRNTQEMEAGTDPTNAESALRLEQPRPADLSESDQTLPAPDQFALYFQTVPGTIYELQSTPALGSPWKSVATVTATTAQKRVLVNKPATNGFYRVFLSP